MSEFKRLTISHQTGQYELLIGRNLLASTAERLAHISAVGPIGIITNTTVNELYGKMLRESLNAAGLVTRTILVPEGEEFKTLASAEQVISALIAQGMERSGTIITLGGGVITDLGGFVASTLFRGVRLVHIPTTLLAMVDAAVGGKTGVNHSSGKNLIGSFYQPELVVMDIDTLVTLEPRDQVSGFAEMLKMGAIRDRAYLDFLTADMDRFLKFEQGNDLVQAIARSCELKSEIVEADEHEAGLRRVLNFGHTLGHAFETILGYGTLRHGEAVVLGMYGAGWLSHQLGELDENEWEKLAGLLLKIPLKVDLTKVDPEAIIKATRLDKKVTDSQLNFVLLRNLGAAHLKAGIPVLMLKLAVDAIKNAWRGGL